jgi:hypothetical protein
MSGIPLIEEFRGLLKGYYRLALNVTEPTIFFSIIVAWVMMFFLVPHIYGKRRVGTKKAMIKIWGYFTCIVSIFFVVLASTKIPITTIMQRNNFYRIDCVLSPKGGKQIGTYRDCDYTAGKFCTKDQPCTPCNLDADLDNHVRARVAEQRACRSCDSSGLLENCNFTEDTGPYCIYKGRRHPMINTIYPASFTDFQVRPCHTCCMKSAVYDYCYNVTMERNVTRIKYTNITTIIYGNNSNTSPATTSTKVATTSSAASTTTAAATTTSASTTTTAIATTSST